MLKILLATFVIISHFAIAEEKIKKIKKPLAKKPPTQCHDLHKVTDIDDLLLQMYNNLDSHCLFEMSKEELEEAWGIPVFHEFEDSTEEWQYRKSADGFLVRRYYSDRDDCETNVNVVLTNNYKKNYQGFGGSFLKGKLPKELPTPVIRRSGAMDQFTCNFKSQTDYKSYKFYIWDNIHKVSFPSILITTMCDAQPISIALKYCNFNFKNNRGWKND